MATTDDLAKYLAAYLAHVEGQDDVGRGDDRAAGEGAGRDPGVALAWSRR